MHTLYTLKTKKALPLLYSSLQSKFQSTYNLVTEGNYVNIMQLTEEVHLAM